jgi:hypothetical protein
MTDDPADDELLLPHESPRQADVRHRIGQLLAAAPFPPEKVIDNLPLFMRLQPLADLLSIDALYRMALDVPGAIMEFGVHRGRHVALFTEPRGVHEPHNPLRRIVGFDTFDGFPDIAAVDELGHAAALGMFALPDGYTSYLRNILSAHEANEPLNHIRRTLLIEGDGRETLPEYLQANPQTIIALAYFDLDLYEPTFAALQAIRPYLAEGSVVAFDEINHPKRPGETAALRDAWGMDGICLRHLPGRATPVIVQVNSL